MLEDVATARSLPQNLEAERSVLGSVLLDSASLSLVVPILGEEDFLPDTHRRIYRAMLELFQRSAEIDALTLKEELDRTGAVEKAGGSAYISTLLDGVPDVSNVEHYARIVKEKSTLRRLIRAGQRLVREGLAQEKNAEDLLGEATGEIFDIAEDSVRGGFTPIGQIVKHNLEIIEEARDRQGILSGLPTGFTELDRLTSGLQSTDLIVLAARPAVGKTSFALNIAQHVAFREGRSVGFFSLEMSKEQIGFRVLCSEADVDAKKVRDGYASKEAAVRLVTAQSKIAGASFFVDDGAALSVPEMRAKAQRLRREKGLDLIVVDYLQLMMGHGRFDNRTQEVSQMSRGLKLLAKELRVPILALSQLSRQPEQRKGELRKPQLADLRDSGCLTADTRILRADTGAEVTLGELFDRGERSIPVWTLDDSLQLVTGRMSHVFSSGIKPVFEIRLASGRSVKASGNHPFLTLDGWRALEELRIGDRLAVPRRIPESSGCAEWPDAHVYGVEDQKTFIEQVGVHGSRSEKVRQAAALLKARVANTNVDTIPMKVWSRVRARMRAGGVPPRAFADSLGVAYRGSMLFRHAPSRRRLAAIAAVLGDPELYRLAESDVFWDTIVRVDPLGDQPVFDATVPATHNFVANGIVAHNSIEQDADVVVFLYREELYNRDTERKGIADVIIAKQRNGPTGDFPLVFLADHMTFANYAGPAMTPEQPF